MVWYPDFDDVDDLHKIAMIQTDEPEWPLIGDCRDKIESALFVPRNLAYYEDADLFTPAAFLMGRLAAAHGYENGNKRTALAVTDLFLAQNGYRLVIDQEDHILEDLLVTIVPANSRGADPLDLYTTMAGSIWHQCQPIVSSS